MNNTDKTDRKQTWTFPGLISPQKKQSYHISQKGNKAYYQVNVRRRFVWPPIKLVFEVSLCFGQSGFDDGLLRDVHLRVLLDKLAHLFLKEDENDQTLWRRTLLLANMPCKMQTFLPHTTSFAPKTLWSTLSSSCLRAVATAWQHSPWCLW